MLDNIKNTLLKGIKLIWSIICTTGIWTIGVTTGGLFLFTAISTDEWMGVSAYWFVIMVIGGLCCSVMITISNLFLWWYYRGYYTSKNPSLFQFFEGYRLYKKSTIKDLNTLFPIPNKKLYINDSCGNIYFGKYHGRDIGKPLSSLDGHVCIAAPSGGGKTTKCVINTILNMIHYNQLATHPQGFLAVDIKGDIGAAVKKVCKHKKWKTRIKLFNPSKKNSYGFNPYAVLEDKDSDDVFEILTEITQILIPTNKAESANEFFVQGGRDYLLGALWYYRNYKGMCFVDSIQKIVTLAPAEFAKMVKSKKDTYIDALYSDIYAYAEGENKYLNLFFSEVKRHVNFIVTNSAIKQALSVPDCRCISVNDLLKGRGILFQVKESKIPIYSKMIALVINLFIRSIVDMDESETSITPNAFIMDEFPQLPAMPSVKQSISTIRSKGVTLVFCAQEPISQIADVYGENVAKNFLSNCTYKIIYGMSGESAEYFSKEIGEYEKKRKSYHNNLHLLNLPSNISVSTSYQKERIMKAVVFQDLKDKRKAVLLSPHGYCQIDVAPWYEKY